MTDDPTPRWLSIAYLLAFLFCVVLFLPLGVLPAIGLAALVFFGAATVVLAIRKIKGMS